MHFIRNAKPGRGLLAALYIGAIYMIINVLPVAAQDKIALAGEYSAARWRSGEMIISESESDADGWLTLGCEGTGCTTLIDSIVANLPPNEQRQVDGRLQLRAEQWHRNQVVHYGPFRAAEQFSNFERAVDGNILLSTTPWLDARHAGFECRWTDAAGNHLLDLTGGSVADYTGPDGNTRPLALDSIDICERCQGMPTLKLTWRDPMLPETDKNELFWVLDRSREGEDGHMYGGAAWPNQNVARMDCSPR